MKKQTVQHTMKVIGTLAGLAAVTTPALAQELPSVPQSLSIADAVSIATQWSPAHRQVVNDRRPASWNVRNAYAGFLPSANISGSLSYTGEGSQRFLSSEFSTPPTKGSSYSVGLNWSLNGQTLVQPALQRARLNAAEAAIANSEITIVSQVIQQYLTVLQAEDEVELAEVQLQRNDEALRLAEARRDVGQGTLLDVRNAEVARGQSEVQLLQERQDVTVEKLRLFQQMGIPAPDDPSVVTLSDSFPVIQLDYTLQELLAMARDRNPNLESLRAQEDAARWGVRSAHSNWWPSISANIGWAGFTQTFVRQSDIDAQVQDARQSAIAGQEQCNFNNTVVDVVNQQAGTGFETTDCTRFAFTQEQADAIRASQDVFPFDFTNQPFRASVSVSVPIFSNFSRPLQVSQANVQLEDAREQVRARELQIDADVNQAFYSMRTSFESIQIQESNRIAAGDALRLATERYRLGQGTFIELLDAQVAAQQAESNYIRALYDYHRAVAQLESAVGRRLR